MRSNKGCQTNMAPPNKKCNKQEYGRAEQKSNKKCNKQDYVPAEWKSNKKCNKQDYGPTEQKSNKKYNNKVPINSKRRQITHLKVEMYHLYLYGRTLQ